jgi:hypothetical protein
MKTFRVKVKTEDGTVFYFAVARSACDAATEAMAKAKWPAVAVAYPLGVAK